MGNSYTQVNSIYDRYRLEICVTKIFSHGHEQVGHGNGRGHAGFLKLVTVTVTSKTLVVKIGCIVENAQLLAQEIILITSDIHE